MTDEKHDLLAQIAAQLAAMQQTTQAGAAAGWTKPHPTGITGLQGVGIPVRLPRGLGGNIRVTLFFGPEHAASPETLHNIFDQLEELGVPLDVWEPRGGERSSWGSDRRDWNSGREGYGQGYRERGYHRGYYRRGG